MRGQQRRPKHLAPPLASPAYWTSSVGTLSLARTTTNSIGCAPRDDRGRTNNAKSRQPCALVDTRRVPYIRDVHSLVPVRRTRTRPRFRRVITRHVLLVHV